jgi:predicted phage tail protein
MLLPMTDGSVRELEQDWNSPPPSYVNAHDYLTIVRLHGSIAQAAGTDRFELMVASVGEIIRALDALTQKRTTNHIAQTGEGVRWRITVDGELIRGDEEAPMPAAANLQLERPMREVDIYPVAEGGDGFWQFILGALLIIVGVVIGIVAGWTGFGGLVAAGLIVSGAASILGGLVGLLFGPGNQAFDSTGEDPKRLPSYLFSGSVNTQRQGGPVPVLYGQMIVGSQLISAGLYTVSKDKEKDSNFVTTRHSVALLEEGVIEDWGDPQTWIVEYPAWYTDAMNAYIVKPSWIAAYEAPEYAWQP